MSRPHSEKRRFPRMEVRHPILVELDGDGENGIFTKTEVLGLGGCMFTNDEPLGHRSFVRLSIATTGRIVTADARVVYEVPSESEGYEVGLEFLRVLPADRRHLARLFADRDQVH